MTSDFKIFYISEIYIKNASRIHSRQNKKGTFLIFAQPYFRVCIPFLHFTLSSPSNHLEHFFGHCGTLLGLKGPSWTFMDPKMDPKMNPARQISGDPW